LPVNAYVIKIPSTFATGLSTVLRILKSFQRKHKYGNEGSFGKGKTLFLARDRVIGVALVVGAVVGVIVYGLLVFAQFWYQTKCSASATNCAVPPGGIQVSLLVLEISAFIAVLAVLAILGWIGYVMATTPPPVPLEPEPTTTTMTEGAPAAPAADKSQQA
jgi:predicted DNA-binding transcriptional regulator